MTKPIAKKVPVEHIYHETRILKDDYAWLKQDNWKEMFENTKLLNPEIRSYLDQENAYTKENLFEPNKQLIEEMVSAMKARMEINYDTAPEKDGPYEYYERYSDANYPIFLRRNKNGQEQVLIDINKELAPNGEKIFLGQIKHSPDHKTLAIVVDYSGSEDYEIIFKNVETGHFLKDKLLHCDRVEWSNDSKKIYYTKKTDMPGEFRIDRIFTHEMGDIQNNDKLVFKSDAANYFLSLYKTFSNRFLCIELRNSQASEIHLLDLKNPELPLVCVAPISEGILYNISHTGNFFYILTNRDGAIEFKIMKAPIETPQSTFWQNYIPYKPGRYIEYIQCSHDYLVMMDRENCLQNITVTRLDSLESYSIKFDDAAYSVSTSWAAEFDDNLLRLAYNSPRTPSQIFDYDLITKEQKLVRQENIPGHNPENYVVERLFFPSHDGVQVPLTILRHKNTPMDGTAPLRLYGYGSYGMNLSSNFGRFNYRYPLIDQGYIFVDVHIRGGADMGYSWYLDGKLKNKKNTFLDFISAAEWLVENKYTSDGKIVIEGRSAGGLLMGSVINMARPGLFGAVVAAVPFIDLMNTILDESLPLTPPEWDEWGNPVKDVEAYDYMRTYSPYDNIERKDYPAIFISGGLTDPRVTYWEPAKWAAKLRDYKTDNNNLFLYIAMDSGHGGDPGRFSHLTEIAQEFAFILNEFKD